MNDPSMLTPTIIEMLVSSLTQKGTSSLSELEAERFLNALARAQSGIPTGVSKPETRG